MDLWDRIKIFFGDTWISFRNIFVTRPYLKHRFLNYLDVLTHMDGKPSENDIMHVIDLELHQPHYICQEVMDELLVTGLIHKDEDGLFTMTEAGRKRLFHRDFIREHNNTVKQEVTTYFLLATNLALALAAIYQSQQDNSKGVVDELKNISHSIKAIDSTIQKEKSVTIRDTVYVIVDSARHK